MLQTFLNTSVRTTSVKRKQDLRKFRRNYALELYATEKRRTSYLENDYDAPIRKEFQRRLDSLAIEMRQALRHEHI